MIQVVFRKIHPDCVERLRSWMSEIQRREDEVRETFRQETVTHEKAYLLQGPDGPVLVYIMELEDPVAARRAYVESDLKIDDEHRKVMMEVVEQSLEPELLYDVRL